MAKKENVVSIKDDGMDWMTFDQSIGGDTIKFRLGKDYVKHLPESFHLNPKEVRELMLLCRRILKV